MMKLVCSSQNSFAANVKQCGGSCRHLCAFTVKKKTLLDVCTFDPKQCLRTYFTSFQESVRLKQDRKWKRSVFTIETSLDITFTVIYKAMVKKLKNFSMLYLKKCFLSIQMRLTPVDLLVEDLSLAKCTRDNRHSSGVPCLSRAASSSLSMLRLSNLSFSEEASFSLKRKTERMEVGL